MHTATASSTVLVSYILVNEGKPNVREEVVRSLKEVGDRSLVAYIKGTGVRTRWVDTSRIKTRSLSR